MVRVTTDDGYLEELDALGAPAALRRRLGAFLRARHPGDQDRIYHGLAHTCEVASLTARMLRSWPRVPAGRKVLLILAAAFHDVDPARAPNTPARVDATIEYFEEDRVARTLLKDFAAAFGFTPKQVLALVMATDYSPTPEEMHAKQAAFDQARRQAFGPDPWVSEWGRRLAFWDQISTYLGPKSTARKRVAGLAREFRRSGEFKGSMTELSRRFLSRLRKDPLFDYLPPRDRGRFEDLLGDLARVRARSSKSRRSR